MKIDEIREKIQASRFAIVDHALREAFKDGISISDILDALRHGKVIEEYPERERCLVYGKTGHGVPVHVVIDYSYGEEMDIVTVYIPNKKEWINFQVRKKK